MSLAQGRAWLRFGSLVGAVISPCLLCGCDERGASANLGGRSDAVSSASLEMSGPSLFSGETLTPAIRALRARADGKVLRLEIRAHELTLQAEDPENAGAVLELHYRDGQVGDAEHATLRGKGRLADNLFELDEVALDAIAALTREAVRRVDNEHGRVELVLVRRNLPESDDVRLRVYVASPHKDGYIDADRRGQPL
jgi:hypothetical protein